MERKRKVLGFEVTADVVVVDVVTVYVSVLFQGCSCPVFTQSCDEGTVHGEVSACASFLKTGNPD